MTPQDLAASNLGFVVQFARHYAGMGLSLDDLIAEGNVGLIEAAHHYDPERGVKFITYAVWWIRKAILNALACQPSIRLPHTLRRKIRTVLDAEKEIAGNAGALQGREGIARRLRTSQARIDRILLHRAHAISLDQAARADSDAPLRDTLPDPAALSPEAALIRDDLRSTVRRGLHLLSDRERRVLACRYGLDDGPRLTLRQIGRDQGLSCEAIRLIERRAKRRLRRILVKGPRRPGSRGPVPCGTREPAARDGRPAARHAGSFLRD